MIDIEEIADQNDPYSNDGTRDKKGRGRKRFSVGRVVVIKKPKWRSQIRALRAGRSQRKIPVARS